MKYEDVYLMRIRAMKEELPHGSFYYGRFIAELSFLIYYPS